MDKDISRYEDDYSALPFEEEQAHLRRIELLKVLQSLQPKRVLEVGGGRLPLFVDYQSFEEMVVVEPGARFAENAVDLVRNLGLQDRVRVEHAFLEEADLQESDFDMVILSALLHEVDDSEVFLRSACRMGRLDTTYLITVPNGNSFHRQLGVRLGLITSSDEISPQQTILQQRRVFDRESLRGLLDLCGLRMTESRTMIFKPFTHGQMQSILDHGILTQKQIHGLCSMMDSVDSEVGSELLVLAKPVKPV